MLRKTSASTMILTIGVPGQRPLDLCPSFLPRMVPKVFLLKVLSIWQTWAFPEGAIIQSESGNGRAPALCPRGSLEESVRRGVEAGAAMCWCLSLHPTLTAFLCSQERSMADNPRVPCQAGLGGW